MLRPPTSARLVQSPVLRRRRTARNDTEHPRLSDDPLRNNPWAIALASPARLCNASNARLPASLTLLFGLVTHPETHAPWLVPVIGDHIKNDKNTAAIKTTNSHALLGSLSAHRSAPALLVPKKWRQPHGPVSRSALKTAVWREDMPEFVLGMLRDEAVRVVSEMVKLKREMEHARQKSSEEDVNDWIPLWPTTSTSTSKSTTGDFQLLLEHADISMEQRSRLRRGVMLTTTGDREQHQLVTTTTVGSIPLYRLHHLLAPTHLTALRSLHPAFDIPAGGALLFVPGCRHAALFVLALWKLEAYLDQ